MRQFMFCHSSQSSAIVLQGYHSDQSTATQTKIWVNYTIGLPLCQFIATLPLECHSDIFQCHSGSLDT